MISSIVTCICPCLPQAMLSEVQDKPNELIKLHTQHFDSLCRNLLEDSAAMEALRSLNPDLLLLDSTFSCGHAVAGTSPSPPSTLPALL